MSGCTVSQFPLPSWWIRCRSAKIYAIANHFREILISWNQHLVKLYGNERWLGLFLASCWSSDFSCATQLVDGYRPFLAATGPDCRVTGKHFGDRIFVSWLYYADGEWYRTSSFCCWRCIPDTANEYTGSSLILCEIIVLWQPCCFVPRPTTTGLGTVLQAVSASSWQLAREGVATRQHK